MIKDEYINIPDEEFVPLVLGIDPSLAGLFEINKLGNIKVTSTGKILKVTPRPQGDYPTVYLRNNGEKFIYRIHILLALTFLHNPNYSVYKEIDHINRDTCDYSLSNLRWVTPSENKKNRVFSQQSFKKYDWWVSDDLLRFSKTNPNENSWTHYFTNEEDLFDRFIFPQDWILIPGSTTTYCSSLGLVLFTDKTLYVTTGYTNKLGYKLVNVNKKLYRVHRLVYSLFSGDTLDDGEFIDHIDTNRANNSLSNLRKVTQKENMNNPLTREKMSRKVLQYDLSGNFIKEFSSCTEAYISLGMDPSGKSGISSCCKGTYNTWGGYIWKYKS